MCSVFLGIKRSIKLQISKSTPKGDISFFFFFLSLFKNYNERLVWTTKFFSCICDIKDNPAYWNSTRWWVGRISSCLANNVWLSSVSERSSALCTALPGKPQALPLQQHLPLAENSSAFINAATNSVNLWDYGINEFNCITVSVQFIL